MKNSTMRLKFEKKQKKNVSVNLVMTTRKGYMKKLLKTIKVIRIREGFHHPSRYEND